MPSLVTSPGEGSSQLGHGLAASSLPSTQAVADADRPSQLTGQDEQRVQANENNSSCADVSSDLSWLRPLLDGNGNGSSPTVSPPEPTSNNINNPSKISAQAHQQPTTSDDTALRPQPTINVTSPKLHISIQQPRKPSPGLAARLKALGIGATKTTSPSKPTVIDRDIGRLSEEQLRQIEEYHRQHETKPVIERKGRPWKGVVRIPSKASLKSANPSKDVATPEDVNVPAIQILDSPGTEEPSELAPKVETPETPETPEPLDMDTNKYRLPDHTNGNGTKVTLDTRREHIERDTRPPPSPESPETPEETPPPVPEKDTPPPPTQSFDPEDYFNPLGLHRTGSIYTISRASFTNQLAQLTSLQLPDAESLAGKVAAIPTAQAAVQALIGAAEQIRSWISKASEVISGLDSDDDVEWSAAGGREGLEEVEGATTRFGELINVYVTAIEELQNRSDIGNVSAEDLTRAVTQMEAIMSEWTNIRTTLRSVRGQVEIAMEWEELWNVVLGEITNELAELSRLVFEMEERRHKSAMVATTGGDADDFGDLGKIVDEKPRMHTRAQAANSRFGLPTFPVSPGSPGGPTISQDDSSLLSLFARMQPLRASLDFLPMRLSVFEARAEKSFPTACDELEMRRDSLDASYRKLEKDAEGLRKELGEDRWVLVFRGAARQAQKMSESVERSLSKLREAVDAGMHLTNLPAFVKKIESYDAKKTHYGPAIDRVLLIIDRGVKDRLTVNGEILRMSVEMQSRWEELKSQIKEMDLTLDELHADRGGAQLRDSVSSMLSNDRSSTVGSGLETPLSSPPSSVIMSGLGIDTRTPGAKTSTSNRTRRSSSSVSSHLPQPGRRSTSANTPQIPRKPVSRLSTYGGLATPSRERSATPTASRLAGSIPRPASTMAHRPKWNISTNTNTLDTGHNFKPLSLTTPSPYAKKTPPNSSRSQSSLAAPMGSRYSMHSPLRETTPSPNPETTPSKPASKMSFRDRLAASGQQGMSKFRPEGPSGRRASLLPPRPNDLGMSPRPASSLATTNRRVSMLPQPRFRRESSVAGRESPMPPSTHGTRMGLSRKNSTSSNDNRAKDRPRFRF
ncbi:hypothetical protein VSDG_07763 [Cytospora chrysosperma]|uniref:Karyogamy protein n=1 Tax=Cytospora chrysosperma TaxID=252740 RepID=A0A423VK46_CYTCH|nr:hypothetical protein VSDG_07763 [Valsa sordida]